MRQMMAGIFGAIPTMTLAVGTAGLGFGMKMTGEGTIEVNIDRGFAQASGQVVTISTQMGSRAIGGVNTPPMQMHGTVKLSQTTVPD